MTYSLGVALSLCSGGGDSFRNETSPDTPSSTASTPSHSGPGLTDTNTPSSGPASPTIVSPPLIGGPATTVGISPSALAYR